MTRTLQDIATHCGATLVGDGSRVVNGPSDLGSADQSEVSFLANPRYAPLLETTDAAGVIVAMDVECDREGLALLRVEDPNRAFTEVVKLFAVPEYVAAAGVHPSSVVDATAELGAGVSVGPLCVIGAGARLGPGVVLRSGVQVGEHVRIGAGTFIHPAVVIGDRVEIGERCVLNAGAVVGAEGFGFEPTAEGWTKIPQCGTVLVGDDVEIGANATIDRARFGATKIGDMVKIDNLVQVAHNCVIEHAALICAQTGMAGSTAIGKRVVLAGQVGIAGHLRIGDGSQVGGSSGVFGTLLPGGNYGGWPARPIRESLRDVANAKRIPELRKTLKDLDHRVRSLEQGAE